MFVEAFSITDLTYRILDAESADITLCSPRKAVDNSLGLVSFTSHAAAGSGGVPCDNATWAGYESRTEPIVRLITFDNNLPLNIMNISWILIEPCA
jgi:hypothetical protein